MKPIIVSIIAAMSLTGCALTAPAMDKRYCLANHDFKTDKPAYKACVAKINQRNKQANTTADNALQSILDFIIDN